MNKKKFFKRNAVTNNDCCHYCGSKENLTVDHKKALVMGGTNELSNMLIACEWCNATKSNADYDVFVSFLKFLEEEGVLQDRIYGRRLGRYVKMFNKKNNLLLHPPTPYAAFKSLSTAS